MLKMIELIFNSWVLEYRWLPCFPLDFSDFAVRSMMVDSRNYGKINKWRNVFDTNLLMLSQKKSLFTIRLKNSIFSSCFSEKAFKVYHDKFWPLCVGLKLLLLNLTVLRLIFRILLLNKNKIKCLFSSVFCLHQTIIDFIFASQLW